MHTRTLVDVYSCTCDKCGHVWRSEELSARCPKCKAPGWDKSGERSSTQVHPDMEPIVEMPAPKVKAEVSREEVIVDLQPKSRQLPPKAKSKRADRQAEKKVTVKGLTRCAHGFTVVDGITLCKECKNGG